MGSKNFDFLTKSFLFQDKSIHDQFRRFSDQEILKELKEYRSFCLINILELENEIFENSSFFKVVSGTELPSLKLLKQTAFYVEQYIINDPLFTFGYPSNSFTKAFNKSINNGLNSIDRKYLASILKYLKSLIPFVIANYVKFLPLNYVLEPPEKLPFLHSSNSFSDVLPQSLIDYFSKNKLVNSVLRSEEEPRKISLEPLFPCREIIFRFKNHTEHGYGYNLFNSEFEPMDGEKVEFKINNNKQEQEPPDNISFSSWVDQSFHLSCITLHDEVMWRNYVASQFRASYLTESSFVFNLLNQIYPSDRSIEINTANTLLNIELPFLEDIDESTLMSIRLNEGEVFQNFRVHLDKQFRELRLITDLEDFKLKTESILHELSVIQIQDINQKIKSILRISSLDVMVALGGISASIYSFQSGEWSRAIFPLSITAERLAKPFVNYSTQVKQNPAFFLWKVLRDSSQ